MMISVSDKVYQTRCKQLFMAIAIPELWNGEEYVEEVSVGCQLIMNEIVDDLEEVIKMLEKEVIPKNIEKFKKQKEA